MLRRISALTGAGPALLAALVASSACGGTERRSHEDPPSGVTDPGHARLSTASGPDFQGAPPQPAAQSGPGEGFVGPLPAAGGEDAPAAPAADKSTSKGGKKKEQTGRAADMITMTREHCETLGRKFADLAVAQNRDNAQLQQEADKIGREFASKCNRDMAGQTVPRSQYDCMLRAQAATELLSCK